MKRIGLDKGSSYPRDGRGLLRDCVSWSTVEYVGKARSGRRQCKSVAIYHLQYHRTSDPMPVEVFALPNMETKFICGGPCNEPDCYDEINEKRVLKVNYL